MSTRKRLLASAATPAAAPPATLPPVKPVLSRAAAFPHLPLKVPLPQAPLVFGLSRSAIYRAAADGRIHLSKLGQGTLVVTESALDFLAGLPVMVPRAVA